MPARTWAAQGETDEAQDEAQDSDAMAERRAGREGSAWPQGQGMDWGTAALFCCEASCTASNEEVVIVQPPVG